MAANTFLYYMEVMDYRAEVYLEPGTVAFAHVRSAFWGQGIGGISDDQTADEL